MFGRELEYSCWCWCRLERMRQAEGRGAGLRAAVAAHALWHTACAHGAGMADGYHERGKGGACGYLKKELWFSVSWARFYGGVSFILIYLIATGQSIYRLTSCSAQCVNRGDALRLNRNKSCALWTVCPK